MKLKFRKNSRNFWLEIKFIEMTKKSQLKNQSLPIPKPILVTAKFLQAISLKLVTLFAAKLFTTPLKHKVPKREWSMETKSIKQRILVPKIKKEIQTYQYGTGSQKVLLVHGWSGRGTQLVKIADRVLEMGYQVISFDAPAHGKSQGKTTLMPEFVASILELEKKYGPFEYAIGHSLGGMSLLNAIKQGLKVKKAVVISSGNIIQDIIVDFTDKLQLKVFVAYRLKDYFEIKTGEKIVLLLTHPKLKKQR